MFASPRAPRVEAPHRRQRGAAAVRYFSLLGLTLLLPHCTPAGRPALPQRPDPAAPPAALRGEESRLLSNLRQVTFSGRRSGEGYFSRDGALMIFQSEGEPDNPFYQIYLTRLSTGETHRVSPGYGKTTCGWIHPNGRKVLFASTHLDPDARTKQRDELQSRTAGTAARYGWDYDEVYDIFDADLNGGHLNNLTHTRGYDAEGSWSPDGRLIVFSSNRHAYTEVLFAEDQAIFDSDKSYMLDIYRMNADGTDVRRLTDAKGADGGAFFSPDGSKIVWRRFSRDGHTSEIHTMNIDGGDQQPVTHLGAMSWAPYFHPSGDYLIFATSVQGFANFELYLIDTKGLSVPVRITFADGFDGLPVFSPDGKSLSWSSSRTATGQPQIFMADWNDVTARLLLSSETTGSSQEPAPAPLFVAPPDFTQTVPDIKADDLRIHVTYLASDTLDGRLTGSDGERRATEYVASVFKWLGLRPAGKNGGFFQPFDFTAGVSLGSSNRLAARGTGSKAKEEYAVDREWRPLAFSKTGSFQPADIVFAGYGIVAAGDGANAEYNSYADLEVAGKWVLVLRYFPERVPPELQHRLSQFANLRYKAMVARERGALGLLVASGPTSNVKDQLIKLSFDASMSETGLAALSVTDGLAEHWLAPAGKNLRNLQSALDSGTQVPGFPLPGTRLEASIHVRQEKRSGRNVLARLESGTTGQPELIVGAHVDHLGEGFATATLARTEEEGMIHYGADDNASGVAGLLEIAQHLAARKAAGMLPLRRDVVFAAWSGEEIGLLGSSFFTRTFGGAKTEPATLSSQVAAYLNMDMIGRLDKQLVLFGVGSSSIWLRQIELADANVGLPIAGQDDSYLATDGTSFYIKGVPILSAFTGAHPDYHTPRDTADKINYGGAEKIARVMAQVAAAVATSPEVPDYVVQKKPNAPVARTNLRAYLGTVPDYAATNVAGLRLTAVSKGGPADEAGLKPGDVVVGLAGKQVDNIYDYTYALDGLKIGVPVQMTVRRGENSKVTTTITPRSRN